MDDSNDYKMRDLTGPLKTIKDILMKKWKNYSALLNGLLEIDISRMDVFDLTILGREIKQITHILDNNIGTQAEYATLKKACEEGYFIFALSFLFLFLFFVFYFGSNMCVLYT